MATYLATVFERMLPTTPWEKRLVVEPLLASEPDPKRPAASIDFHLGTRFSVPRRRRAVRHDPLSEDERLDIAASELFVALGEEFVLHPGQLVLGTTLEWYRFPADLMAYVVGRSIWGRRGLLVATATAVQPGSAGTITLELSNVGEIAVVLKPGAAIGQLFFHVVADVPPTDFTRVSPFAGAHGPILGHYSRSLSENYLLGADGNRANAPTRP